MKRSSREDMGNRSLPIIFGLFLALLAGCGQAPVVAVPTSTSAAQAAQTATPRRAAVTPQPSLTDPAPARTPEPTPSATAEITSIPTVDSAMAEIALAGLGWVEGYDILLSLDFPAPVDPQAYRVTLEDKEFPCQVLAKLPNRLYCLGQGARVMAEATVRVYRAGSTVAGFEKQVWVPFFTNSYNWPNE